MRIVEGPAKEANLKIAVPASSRPLNVAAIGLNWAGSCRDLVVSVVLLGSDRLASGSPDPLIDGLGPTRRNAMSSDPETASMGG